MWKRGQIEAYITTGNKLHEQLPYGKALSEYSILAFMSLKN